MSEVGRNRLLYLMGKHRNVFRINQGPDTPVRVAPLVVTLRENARPYSYSKLKYDPLQRAFIKNTVMDVESVK